MNPPAPPDDELPPLPARVQAPRMPPRPHRRRARPLIRSAGVRFALAYAMVFGVSAFALAFSIWYSTVDLLQRQVEVDIRNDALVLNEHYELGGLPSLIAAIHDRLTDVSQSDGIYLLEDALGNRLIGNLDVWPKGLDQVDTWYELPVTRNGQASVALLRAYSLPGSGELLVGRDVSTREKLRNVLRDGLLWALGLMFALGILGALLIRSLFRRMMRDISTTTRASAVPAG